MSRERPYSGWLSSIALAGCIAWIGCGDDSPDSPQYTEQQVVSELGAQTNQFGSHTLDGCSIDPIIIGAEQIEVYEDAGDTLVKNPSGTVAIKSSDLECADTLQGALNDLP